jgi:hypothetical protein
MMTGMGTPSSQRRIAGIENSFLNGFVNDRSVRNRSMLIQADVM